MKGIKEKSLDGRAKGEMDIDRRGNLATAIHG